MRDLSFYCFFLASDYQYQMKLSLSTLKPSWMGNGVLSAMYWFIPNYFGGQFNYTRRKIRHKSIRDFSWWKSTVCPRSSDPFMCNLLYKTGHYFLYRLYGLNNRCMIPVDKLDGSDDYGNYTSMRGTFTSRIWMPDVFLDRGKAIRGVFFYIFGLLNTGV